ncbi:MAG: hypothetical protein L3J62_03110 [Gammaproteobacteria bacterium]|nr:hypothetical protein [Gammaproteobacteria bacterium]
MKARSLTSDDGKAGLVRNGYLPERTIQTGLGDITVKIPITVKALFLNAGWLI